MREGGERANPVAMEHSPATTEPELDHDEDASPEKQEEVKLRAKYGPTGLPAKGASQFLQKRLQQRKFFDSGDYNMAKAKGQKLLPGLAAGPKVPPLAATAPVTIKPVLNVTIEPAEPSDGSTSPTGVEIPTPATVPQRKSSIIYPSASKLSPQPLHHHTPDSLTATLEMA